MINCAKVTLNLRELIYEIDIQKVNGILCAELICIRHLNDVIACVSDYINCSLFSIVRIQNYLLSFFVVMYSFAILGSL